METVEQRVMHTSDLARPTTIGDSLVAAMRDEILNGDLAPGTRLNQAQLAQRFGTSRIPMRDALARLEQDGLVEIDARRGARVRELTIDDVTEIYDMRQLLEPLAVRLSVDRAHRESVRRLVYLSEAMDAASAEPDGRPSGSASVLRGALRPVRAGRDWQRRSCACATR